MIQGNGYSGSQARIAPVTRVSPIGAEPAIAPVSRASVQRVSPHGDSISYGMQRESTLMNHALEQLASGRPAPAPQRAARATA